MFYRYGQYFGKNVIKDCSGRVVAMDFSRDCSRSAGQHTWEGLGHAMLCSAALCCELLLHYVLVSCAECLRIGAPPSYNIRATSLCQPSLATAGVRHQIYGKDSFPILSIPHLELRKYPALNYFSLVTTLN